MRPARAALAAFSTLSILSSPLVSTAGEEDRIEPVQPAAPARFEEEIVVTGTRIPRKDLTTPAPVTVLSREQLLASGKPSIGDFLQTLPEQGNALNASVNNGGDGSTRVSLRGLGDHRTLVLLNGRRFVPGGSGADRGVDLSMIPTAAVERIEVLKDGASAVYGSDAIGGVVNVVTRKRWSGAEASAYSGLSSRGDGALHDVSLTLGQSTDMGSVLFSAAFARQEAVWAGRRDFSRVQRAFCQNAAGQTTPGDQANNCAGATRDGLTGEYAVGNGITTAGRLRIPDVAKGQPIPNPANDPRIDLYDRLIAAYPSSRDFVRDPRAPLGWRPFLGPSLPQDGGDGYNFAPANYLVTPGQRLSLFATGERRLGGSARGYFETSFVNRQSQQKLAPEPLDTASSSTVVSARNRWNPFGVDLADVRRRLEEFSNRSITQDVDAFRVVVGIDGTLPDAAGPVRGWFWDVSLNHGRTLGTATTMGLVRLTRLQGALGPSFDYGTKERPDWGCGTGPNDRVAGCVPLNLFGGPGSIGPDQIHGLTFTGTARGTNTLTAVQANTAGELFQLAADRPVSLAAGYEYRQVSGSNIPDPITVAGETATDATVKVTAGAQDVHEAYVELSAPVVSGLPFAEQVEATAAARAFRYSGFAADWTWKLGARWTPLRDVTLRGTVSTAFRAPTVAELYYGASTLPIALDDPCAGVDSQGRARSTSPACGAAANNGLQDPVVKLLGGGNPKLHPEKAHTFTMGVVLEPRFARELTVTLDYFAISIDGAIRQIGPLALLGACYPMSPGVAPRFCDVIARDPSTHELATITDLPQNAWTERMAGADLAIRYGAATPLGRFGLGLAGTWLQRYDLVNADGSVMHAKGTNDWWSAGTVGGVYPALKVNAGVSWALRDVGAGVGMRYLGSFKECADATGQMGLGYCSFDPVYSRTVAAYTVWDARVSYGVTTGAGRTDVAVGVQNLLDARPATIYGGFIAASDPTAYDFMGRFFYVRISQRL